MAKTVKFNLICDGKPVRTIEDLQNNFSIEDVLEYYQNGLLKKWLSVREYTTEFDKVSNITSNDKYEIIRELINIFDVTIDQEEVDKTIYMLEFLEKKQQRQDNLDQEEPKEQEIIRDYKQGYEDLIGEITTHPRNSSVVKASIREIISNYKVLFDTDYRNVFYKFVQEGHYFVIMCLLMNEDTRRYFLPEGFEKGRGMNKDRSDMYEKLIEITSSTQFIADMGENLKCFYGHTDGYWRDVEPKGKKCMLITMGMGDFVRPAKAEGISLTFDDVANKYVILDGIEYKGYSDERRLYYMEV